MSQLNVDTIKKADGTGSLTVPAESGTVVTTASPSLGRRNLIINGAMQVAQRGTSSTGQTSAGYKDVDRFFWDITTIGTHTTSQSTDAPNGFSNSAKIEVTTADAAPTGSDRLALQYKIEAQDLQGLAYGTSSAKSLTLSFWVKSNKTGTYSNELMQQDNSNKHWSFDYTISSANTWEYKTVTFTGDTSGVINNDNGSGLQIKFWFGAGSDYTSGTYSTGQWQTRTAANAVSSSSPNVADTIGNTWQITGVQLEVGSVATPFEHRSYGEELALCQRYFCKVKHDGSYRNNICLICNHNDVTHYGIYHFPVTMRSAPTGTVLTGTYRAYPGGAATNFSESDISVNIFSPESVRVGLASSAGAVGDTSWLECYLSGAGLLFDAEL